MPASAWYSAEEYCESHYSAGFLASIRNAFETSYIQNLLRNSPLSTDVWIGGFRTADSPFQWTDGEPFSYTQFAPGQPDPSGSCIQICSKDRPGCRLGQWKTTPCSGVTSSFFCEYDGSGLSTTMLPSSSTLFSSTLPPFYPCIRDVLILMDNSIGVQNKDNYIYQVMFISLTLINGWTVSPSQIEANPAVYSGNLHNFLELGSFSFENVDELRHATNAAATLFGANDPPSIKVGLQAATMNTEVNGWRRGVPRVTLLFTSSSDPVDVTAALPYAAQLKSNGSSLIVVGMGPRVTASILSPIASGSSFLFTQPYFNVFLNDTTLANQINNAICATPPTTMPTTTSVSTTTTLLPSYPCMRDVLILVDVSIGLRSQTNFDSQIVFITAALISSGWTVSTLQLEANPVGYEKGNYVPQGSFGYNSAEELKETLQTMYWLQDDPSIAYGLEEVANDHNLGWRAGVPRVVLLFTSTSDLADVAQAQQYSDQLKNSNHTIIVVGMGPAADKTVLSQLASGAINTFTSDFGTLATNNALAAQLNAAICRVNSI
uniref:Uncharacterized protein n=1 Tax=Plectus sambesii TaxID=2011161 RepID=A0A914X885_9BILA